MLNNSPVIITYILIHIAKEAVAKEENMFIEWFTVKFLWMQPSLSHRERL